MSARGRSVSSPRRRMDEWRRKPILFVSGRVGLAAEPKP